MQPAHEFRVAAHCRCDEGPWGDAAVAVEEALEAAQLVGRHASLAACDRRKAVPVRAPCCCLQVQLARGEGAGPGPNAWEMASHDGNENDSCDGNDRNVKKFRCTKPVWRLRMHQCEGEAAGMADAQKHRPVGNSH